MPDGPLERDLLPPFREGRPDALVRVFERYVDDVTRTLRGGVRIVHDGRQERVGAGLPDHEIEALLHETFVRAFRPSAREAYDGLRPYGAYLATIARNLLIDRARRIRRDATFVTADDAAVAAAVGDAADAEQRAEERGIATVLADVLSALPERDAAIFRARFEHRRSLRETAADLGLSLIVVRRVDVRLRALLLDRLRDAGYLRRATVEIPSRWDPRRET